MQVLYHVTTILFGNRPLLFFHKKRCTTCLVYKDIDDFHVHSHTWDGLREVCKECRKNPNVHSFSSQTQISSNSKICIKCLKERKYDEFNERVVNNDGYETECRECQQEDRRQFRQEHHEKLLVYDRNRSGNARRKEQHNRRYREAYSQNPEFVKKKQECQNKWYRENPLLVREQWMRRDAREKGARTGRVSYKRILQRDGYYCYICNQPILPHHNLEFDHCIPILPRTGEPQGSHTEDNIHPTHAECNGRKSNRRFEDLTPYERRGIDY